MKEVNEIISSETFKGSPTKNDVIFHFHVYSWQLVQRCSHQHNPSLFALILDRYSRKHTPSLLAPIRDRYSRQTLWIEKISSRLHLEYTTFLLWQQLRLSHIRLTTFLFHF